MSQQGCSNQRRPRDGQSVRVVIVARISTAHQDPRSLDDQIATCQAYVNSNISTSATFRILQSQGSGEHLDRRELGELEGLIESNQFDFVVAEDLGRICRRQRAIDFCELCQDHKTVLIAINDRVDTSVPGWQDSAFIATWHHERSNRDTSDRIKRSLNNRFDQGQLMELLVYGYIRPQGATSDSQLLKDPAAEPVIREIFRRLEGGASFSEIADWLNATHVSPGPYCRSKKWTCAIVSRFVHCPLLKGQRIRNRHITERINKTGHHRSVKAPPELRRVRECPHLAFFEQAYYDHVIRDVDARNAKYRRAKNGKLDSRKGVPKCRTVFPGQHLRCAVCGRHMYWSISGGAKSMVCSGAQAYFCWNSLTVPAARYTQRITDAVLLEILRLPNFDTILADEVRERLLALPDQHRERQRVLEAKLQTIETSLQNIANAFEKAPSSETLLDRLQQLEAARSEVAYQLRRERQAPVEHFTMPTADEVTKIARDLFGRLVKEDQEAGRIMRRLIPEMLLVPYRCIDGGAIVPRVRFTINLAALLPDGAGDFGLGDVLTKELTIDMFDQPQRVRFLPEIVAAKGQGRTEREIAASLGITQPPVQYALKLHRQMLELGTQDPYQLVTCVPQGEGTKLRRHKHERFDFHPLEGFPKYQ